MEKLLFFTMAMLYMIAPGIAIEGDSSNCKHCEKTLQGLPEKEISHDLIKLSKFDPGAFQVSTQICRYYLSSGQHIVRDAKNEIIYYLKKYRGIKDPSAADMITFLNKNKDELTCAYGKNYMITAIDQTAYKQLFRGLLLNQLRSKERSMYIDMNAVSYIGETKKPTTVIDYIDIKLSESGYSKAFFKELKRLRRMLTKHFGAKKFAELEEGTKKKYYLKVTRK